MNCFICGHNKWKPLYNYYIKCYNCGFVRSSDRYFNINQLSIYHKNYYEGQMYKNYKDERQALENNFSKRLQKILKYKTHGKLLEIGCAFGYFLSLAKKHYSVSGIDINPYAVKIASKISGEKIIAGDLLKKKFKNSFFDVICMFDTIEHLVKPDKYLSKISKLLKNDGILAIETGDIDSLLSKIQRKSWRLFNPKIHLSYFSKKTLITFLKKNGFSVIDVARIGFSRSLPQILFHLRPSLNRYKLIDYLYPIILKVNTYDLIFIIAKKDN